MALGKQVISEADLDRAILVAFNRENAPDFDQSKNLSLESPFKQDWKYFINVTNGGVIEVTPDELYKKVRHPLVTPVTGATTLLTSPPSMMRVAQ